MQDNIEYEVGARIEMKLIEHEVMDRINKRLKLEGGAGAEQAGISLIEKKALLKEHKIGVMPESVVKYQGKGNKSDYKETKKY